MEPEHVWHRPDVDMKYLCFFNYPCSCFHVPDERGQKHCSGAYSRTITSLNLFMRLLFRQEKISLFMLVSLTLRAIA